MLYVTYMQSDASARVHAIALKTFAGIGFITVLVAGFWLAAYLLSGTSVLSRSLGTAAIYLGLPFSAPREGQTPLVVEPSAPKTALIEETAPPLPTTPSNVAPRTETKPVYEIAGTAPASYFGLPDLSVKIDAIGYLAATTSIDSFVASTTVPKGLLPAIRFTAVNQGTNVTGTWNISASLPTQGADVRQFSSQPPLSPGEGVSGYISFEQAAPGVDKMVSITVNSDSAFAETTRDNNSASSKLTILGS